MGDKLALSSINIKNMHEGVANNIVGQKGQFYHGCTEFSLNFLVSKKMLPQPTHIKIDVDGYEDRVIEGAMEVLRNTKSILLEIANKNKNYVNMIEALGFKVESKHKRNEDEFNYIFVNEN